jgi:hypothetical protein
MSLCARSWEPVAGTHTTLRATFDFSSAHEIEGSPFHDIHYYLIPHISHYEIPMAGLPTNRKAASVLEEDPDCNWHVIRDTGCNDCEFDGDVVRAAGSR